jgi:hypothetical protein
MIDGRYLGEIEVHFSQSSATGSIYDSIASAAMEMIAVRQMALPLECRRLIKQFAFEPHPVALLLKPLVWVEEDSTLGLTRRYIYSQYDEENPNDEPFFLRRVCWSKPRQFMLERTGYFPLHTYWWPTIGRL